MDGIFRTQQTIFNWDSTFNGSSSLFSHLETKN